ncbi:hypothetical protein STEG23_012868 [Scotinomys teguina]
MCKDRADSELSSELQKCLQDLLQSLDARQSVSKALPELPVPGNSPAMSKTPPPASSFCDLTCDVDFLSVFPL